MSLINTRHLLGLIDNACGTGQGGRQPWPAKVLIVATHGDKVTTTKNAQGELVSEDANVLLTTVQQKFIQDFDICSRVFVMDAHLAMSADVKALRAQLGDIKAEVVQVNNSFSVK